MTRDSHTRAQALVLGCWRDVSVVYGSRVVCGLVPVGLRGYLIDASTFQARRQLGTARYVRTLTDGEGQPLCIVDPAVQ